MKNKKRGIRGKDYLRRQNKSEKRNGVTVRGKIIEKETCELWGRQEKGKDRGE